MKQKTEKTNKPQKTKKKEFVEIEFIARQEGKIFDTNIKTEAKKLNAQAETKPLIVCIGRDMV